MLEIVQHYEHALPRKVGQQLLLRVALLIEGEAHRLRDRGHNAVWRLQPCQGDEVDTMLEVIDAGRRYLDCQARLAAATGTNERQQPAARISQAFADVREFPFSADERDRLGWQLASEAGGWGETFCPLRRPRPDPLVERCGLPRRRET